jgi:D-alanyl-D-alanine carboxypeptidase (penicillin-binding protein 5/6)
MPHKRQGGRKLKSKKKRRRNRRRRKLLLFLVIICIAIVLAISYLALQLNSSRHETGEHSDNSSVSVSEPNQPDSSETSDISGTSPEPTQVTPEPLRPAVTISPDSIISVYGYMERVSDGSVVLDKSAHDRMYPASMTKAMTLLVAIENLPDLEEKIQVTADVINPLHEQQSSMAGFDAGEWVSVRDLLYGIFLPSGGEAAVTIANRVAGSEAAFAELMNQKAAELGLTGTHFVNCTGLHDDNHYSTCVDIAYLFETALQNDLFYQIATTHSYTCEPTDFHPEGLELQSTMFASLSNISSPTLANGAVILGGKTGTTDEGGNCLVSFADYNGQRYILVTGLGQFNAEGRMYNIEDAVTAYSALQ